MMENFDFVGLLRTIQPTLIGAGFTIAIAIIVIISLRLVIRSASGFGETSEPGDWGKARQVITWFCGLAIVLSLVWVGWRVAEVTVGNRMPRNEVDRSGIYKQAEEHLPPASQE